MAKKKFKAEQVVMLLREVEMQLSKGLTLEEACRNQGFSTHSYYRWRKEYGGMKIDQAKRLRDLEEENSRLKKLVADLSLDNSILKEVSRGNF